MVEILPTIIDYKNVDKIIELPVNVDKIIEWEVRIPVKKIIEIPKEK